MRSVNIHDAKTHFSRLVDDVAEGESVVIAKAGSPVARLVPLDAEPPRPRSLVGFMSGRISIPDDFDRMGGDELAAQFEGAGPAASR
jgi:prevent-host-death family protein